MPFILRWEIMKGFEQKRVMINLCFNIIILASMLNIYTGGNGGMMETSYKIFTLIQGRKNSRLDNGVNCGHEEPCSDSGYISGRLIGFVGRPTTCYEKKGKPIFWPEKLEEWNCHLLRWKRLGGEGGCVEWRNIRSLVSNYFNCVVYSS